MSDVGNLLECVAKIGLVTGDAPACGSQRRDRDESKRIF